MKFLKYILSCLSAKTDASFAHLFEQLGNPYFLICMIESYLLSGEDRLLMFWNSEEGNFFSETQSNKTFPLRKMQISPIQLLELKSQIELFDSPKLADFHSSTKDGVEYTVLWGTYDCHRVLQINNPEENSVYEKIVSLIEKSADLLTELD